MMTAPEMLELVERFLKNTQREIENENKQQYPDKRRLYGLNNTEQTLSNLFGQFKYGPRKE